MRAEAWLASGRRCTAQPFLIPPAQSKGGPIRCCPDTAARKASILTVPWLAGEISSPAPTASSSEHRPASDPSSPDAAVATQSGAGQAEACAAPASSAQAVAPASPSQFRAEAAGLRQPASDGQPEALPSGCSPAQAILPGSPAAAPQAAWAPPQAALDQLSALLAQAQRQGPSSPATRGACFICLSAQHCLRQATALCD